MGGGIGNPHTSQAHVHIWNYVITCWFEMNQRKNSLKNIFVFSLLSFRQACRSLLFSSTAVKPFCHQLGSACWSNLWLSIRKALIGSCRFGHTCRFWWQIGPKNSFVHFGVAFNNLASIGFSKIKLVY